MKKSILLAVILTSMFSYSQTEDTSLTKPGNGSNNKETFFTYDANGLSPKNVSLDVKGMDKKDLYSKSLDWLKEKYHNHEKIVIENEKNQKISFEGFTYNSFCFGEGSDYGCEDLTYVIELSFKDGEYKFKPKKLSYTTNSNKKEKEISLDNSDFYKNNGDIKEKYTKVPEQMQNLFNSLNKSLFNYLTNKEQENEW
jgi:hypothetical protein